MTTTVRKVDGGLHLRIPDDVAARLGLADGTEVTLTDAAGQLTARKRPTLAELVAGITPENCHGEVDWGPPVGKERFWEDE